LFRYYYILITYHFYIYTRSGSHLYSSSSNRPNNSVLLSNFIACAIVIWTTFLSCWVYNIPWIFNFCADANNVNTNVKIVNNFSSYFVWFFIDSKRASLLLLGFFFKLFNFFLTFLIYVVLFFLILLLITILSQHLYIFSKFRY
jgi:hypothetical protein